jgi:hypothetical protein
MNWERMNSLANRWLPPARARHPIPACASTPLPEVGAQCGSPARWDLRGGRPQGRSPTATLLLLPESSFLKFPGHDNLAFDPDGGSVRLMLSDLVGIDQL